MSMGILTRITGTYAKNCVSVLFHGNVPCSKNSQVNVLVSVYNTEEAARWNREGITGPALQGDQSLALRHAV